MTYEYFNTGVLGAYYSEAELPFGSPQDWTDADVKTLTLYFYGDPGNDANETEQLYVGLGGSYAQVNCPDMNAVLNTEWTEWNIPISEFAGVDPCAVTSLFIGFGDRSDTGPVGGEGIVYFDDIRLYPPKCIPELGPAYDFSGNCIVDWPDLQIMAYDWLEHDIELSVTAPGDGPVAHWELDDTNTVATDSAGSNHGTLEGTVSWVTGKVGSGAAEFGSDDARIRVPHSAELMPATEVSVAAWIYPRYSVNYAARVMAKGLNAGNWEAYRIQFDGSPTWTIRSSDHENHGVDGPESPLNEWTHVTGTYDGNDLNLYINGQQIDVNDANSGNAGLLQDANDLSIGNTVDGNDRLFEGRIDDVRVYDVALTDTEVAYVATGGTGYFPVDSIANIHDYEPLGQRAVNIKDCALLMDSWLEEKFWSE
jgi:hypothetical protein